MNTKRTFWIVLICALVVIAIVSGLVLLYLSVVNPTVKMQGMVVDANGTVQEELSLSVSSKMIRSGRNSEKALELTFKLPEDFPYKLDQLTSISTDGSNPPYDVLMGFCYDAAANESVFAQCAYDKDASLIIVTWDNAGKYLVASADSDMTAEAIMEHFQDFLKSLHR